MTRWHVALPLLLATAACSHTMPDYTVKSVSPGQAALPDAHLSRSEAPRSTLPVMLEADLSPIQQTIEQAVPERFTEADHPLGTDYRWRFVRDGAPEVAIQDGIVTVRAAYKGDLESKLGAHACRLDPLYPVIETTGRLLLQENNGALVFSLGDPRTAVDLKSDSDSRCNMFNSPVKDQLAELVNRDRVAQAIQRAVDDGRFQIPLRPVLARLHGPLPVRAAGTDAQVCVYGAPADMVVGPLKGTAKQTTIPIAVRQAATAAVESQCRKPSATPVTVTSGSIVSGGEPYQVLASLAVPYITLNHSLQDRLFHQQVTVDGVMKDEILIEEVTARDADGKVLLSVTTSGDLVGKIYYWGTPQLESNGTTLRLPDLRMTNESKTMLDEVKVGYWQQIDEQLRPKLIDASTIDVGDRLRQIRSAMDGKHDTGDLVVDLLMARHQPRRAYSTPTGLVADVLLEGTASANGRVPVEGSAPRIERTPAQSDRPSVESPQTPAEPERPSPPALSEAPAVTM